MSVVIFPAEPSAKLVQLKTKKSLSTPGARTLHCRVSVPGGPGDRPGPAHTSPARLSFCDKASGEEQSLVVPTPF